MPEATTITCATCTKPFLILAQEKEFYDKKALPSPTHCSSCRREKRLSLKNGREFHKRTCDKCQKQIITTYRPDEKFQVFCQECFWSNIG